MLNVVLLIVAPAWAWDRIAAAGRGYFFILVTYLLPFIALDAAVEGWSLEKWGKWQSHFQITKSFSHATVLHFEILHALLWLGMVFVSALLVWVAAENFNGRRPYVVVFSTIAYGYSPLFLANLMNVSPTMNPFVPWIIGIMASIWILYQGVPRGLKTDPVHAFGIYLSTIMVVFLVSGMVHALTALYLLGRIDFQNSWLLQQIGHWLHEI